MRILNIGFDMWRISPEAVLSLYQEILQNTTIKLEDLYLYDNDNPKNPVMVRETGRPAYNPINKWNNGTVSTSTGGGAIHLTSPPNSIGAEIYLGAAATIIRQVQDKIIKEQDKLICAAQYGQPHRNSDPMIGFKVNQLVLNYNLLITLTNPIGLYGQKITEEIFRLPQNANKKLEDCYKVVRGHLASNEKPFLPQ